MSWTEKTLTESTSQEEYENIDAGNESGIDLGGGISLGFGVEVGDYSEFEFRSNQVKDSHGWSNKTKPSG